MDCDPPQRESGRQHRLAPTAVMGTLLCAALWGGQSVAVKLAVASVPPFLMMSGRTVVACAFAFFWAKVTHHRLRLSWGEMGLVLANCMLLYTQIGLFSIGTSLTESVRSIVLINSFPVFTALVCLIFIAGNTLGLRHIAGLAAAILGIFLVFANRFGGWDLSVWQGDILVLMAAAVMGTQVVFFKAILRRLHPSQTVFWGSCWRVPSTWRSVYFLSTPCKRSRALCHCSPFSIKA